MATTAYITSLLSKSESQDATTRSDDGDTGSFLEPCDDRDCPLHATDKPTHAAQNLLASLVNPATGSQISDIVEAARWRRKSGSLENIRQEVLGRRDQTSRHRALSDLPLPIGIMEEVHGVDVSWLHKPNKGKICFARLGGQCKILTMRQIRYIEILHTRDRHRTSRGMWQTRQRRPKLRPPRARGHPHHPIHRTLTTRHFPT